MTLLATSGACPPPPPSVQQAQKGPAGPGLGDISTAHLFSREVLRLL